MNLRPTLLPALGVFAVAARHQNFALAGEELHLTASAVSHHVRKLESLLGAPLFQRHARGVTLTAEGRQLADAASAALADVSAVAGNLRPRPDTVPLRVTTARGPLQFRLFAAWERDHYAAAALEDIARRLADFCADRYGEEVRP